MERGDRFAFRRRTDNRTDRYSRESSRDISGCWRDEYDHQSVPIPDGGQQQDGYAIPRVGAIVSDQQADEPVGGAIIVDTHPEAIARNYWIEDLNATVADVNTDCPPDCPVVTVVFLDHLRDAGINVSELNSPDRVRGAVKRADVDQYDYPVTRVEEVKPP